MRQWHVAILDVESENISTTELLSDHGVGIILGVAWVGASREETHGPCENSGYEP